MLFAKNRHDNVVSACSKTVQAIRLVHDRGGRSTRSVPEPTKRQKGIAVTGLGGDDLSINGATSDVEPHAISCVTKSKMVTVDAIANNETFKFKDVGPLSMRTVDDGPWAFSMRRASMKGM